jgi:hypothetical protein
LPQWSWLQNVLVVSPIQQSLLQKAAQPLQDSQHPSQVFRTGKLLSN